MILDPLKKFYLNRLLSKLDSVPVMIREEIGYLKLKVLIEKILCENTQSQQEVFQALDKVALPANSSAINQSCTSTYAIFMKGFCYWLGIGVKKNNEKALELFNSLQFDQLAICAKAEIYLGSSKDKQATAHRILHAAQKDEVAISSYLLGIYGLMKELPIDKIIVAFRMALNAGLSAARLPLADLLWQQGGIVNLENARALCDEAAKQVDVLAQYKLSYFLENGIGGPKDLKESFDWCYQAALQNNGEACCALGLKYLRGIGIEFSLKLAFEWLHKADKTNNLSLEGEFEIAKFYAKGLANVTQNLDKACFHYIKILEFSLKNKQNKDNNNAVIALQNKAAIELLSMRKDMNVMARSGNLLMQSTLANLYSRNLYYKPLISDADFRLMQVKLKLNLIDELDLSDQLMSVDLIYTLLTDLAKNTSVKTLDLTGSPLKSNTMEYLSTILEDNDNITGLHLGQTNIDNSLLEKLSKCLSKNTKLQELSLWGNDIGSARMVDAHKRRDVNGSRALCRHKSEMGLLSIVNALKRNKHTALRSLWLADNRLDFQCLKYFKTLLEVNKSLCYLTFGAKEGRNLSFGTDFTPTFEDVRTILSTEDNEDYTDDEIEDLTTAIQLKLKDNQKTQQNEKHAAQQKESSEQNERTRNNMEGEEGSNLCDSSALVPLVENTNALLTIEQQIQEQVQLDREEQMELEKSLERVNRIKIEELQSELNQLLRQQFHYSIEYHKEKVRTKDKFFDDSAADSAAVATTGIVCGNAKAKESNNYEITHSCEIKQLCELFSAQSKVLSNPTFRKHGLNCPQRGLEQAREGFRKKIIFNFSIPEDNEHDRRSSFSSSILAG